MDVLYKRVDENLWSKKLFELSGRVNNQELVKEELILVKALTKMPKDYEGSITDKKTGKPKIKANGEIQAKAIPAHVKLAERMINNGKDLYIGSKIPYIVIKNKPILALSPEEFEKKSGKFMTKSKRLGEYEYEFTGEYDAEYYWLRILKPLLKVTYTYFKRIPDWSWSISNAKLHKMIEKLEEDDDD
jgi:DNA polymerase elongation subunit (family B)